MPSLPKMLPKKIAAIFPKRKLRAATTSSRRADAEDYAEEEPNVRLSSAFAVMLVLHVVAVGGIYAFNSIKAHRAPAFGNSADGAQTNSASTTSTPDQPSAAKPESSERSADSAPAVMPVANVSGAKIYRVKAGDTLSKIAATNGVSVDDLEEANGLKNVAALRVGQELKIPAKQAGKPVAADSTRKTNDAKKPSDATAKSSASPGGAVKDSGEIHVVAKGETPLSIAKKLHVSYDDLLKLNKIDDPKKLQIGQKLKIPVKRSTN